MLATLYDHAFDDKEWLFEIKWDGYRAVADLTGKEPLLYSRNGLSFAEEYEAVYEELKKIKKKVVLDGEIVVLDEEGRPSFQLLQQYRQRGEGAICYYVFDCLKANGRSIEHKTLAERKDILRALLPVNDLIRYCDDVEEQGKAFFALVRKKGLEGIIAKRADGTYKEGARTRDWLKIKNIQQEEAVIAGYTAPRGGRAYFGALVLGIYQKGKLRYIGHTGTGFDNGILKEMWDLMQPLKTSTSPFDTDVPVNSAVTWLRPELVCNIKYSEITEGGNRRHPVFLGLRADKAAKDVTGEVHAKKRPGTKKK